MNPNRKDPAESREEGVSMPSFDHELILHAYDLWVVKLERGEMPGPECAEAPFVSWTRNATETCVVMAATPPPGRRAEGPYRGFEISGTVDFATVGLIAALAKPLADRGIAIFVVSTYDTDWVLVKSPKKDDAAAALRDAGFRVRAG